MNQFPGLQKSYIDYRSRQNNSANV